MAARGWGYWTEAKLEILSDYLPAFARASSLRAPGMTYLDLFAGNDENQRRDTGQDIRGSSVRALEALPDHATVVLFELPKVATELRAGLRARFPGRRFEVVEGDCNETIGGALAALKERDMHRGPVFAFVDPYSSGLLRWDTLRQLAEFKQGVSRYKVELWVLFYGSDIPRVLGASEDARAQVTRTFGSDDWEPIAQARSDGVIDAEVARREYTNLLRWRLERVLGYARTHTLEVKNTSGAYLYDLVFATDNEAGDHIMADVYRKGLERSEAMRREAAELRREERTGQASLFAASELGSPSTSELRSYRHEAPTAPFHYPGTEDE